jgi:hypothetical protein
LRAPAAGRKIVAPTRPEEPMRTIAALLLATAVLVPAGPPVASAQGTGIERRAAERPAPQRRDTRPATARRTAQAPRPVSRPPRIMTDEETRAYHRDMTNSKIGD